CAPMCWCGSRSPPITASDTARHPSHTWERADNPAIASTLIVFDQRRNRIQSETRDAAVRGASNSCSPVRSLLGDSSRASAATRYMDKCMDEQGIRSMKKLRIVCQMVLIGYALFGGVAQAATYYVSKTGTGSTCSDFQNINRASGAIVYAVRC